MGDMTQVPQPRTFAALTPGAANLVPQKAPSCAASGCGTRGPLFRGTLGAATGALAVKQARKKEHRCRTGRMPATISPQGPSGQFPDHYHHCHHCREPRRPVAGN